MEKYEINKETLAVVGINKKTTKVLEKSREYIINDIAYEVMEHSCQYFGSSYGGRVEGSKKMIDSNYKLPIIVEEPRIRNLGVALISPLLVLTTISGILLSSICVRLV